jgi:4-hydroxy-tetrahydrodipicolinate reductase
MGQTLIGMIAAAPHFQVIGGIDKEAKSEAEAADYGCTTIETAATASELLRAADVILDFSAVAALHALLAQRSADLTRKAVVIGTTGLTTEVQQQIAQLSLRSAVIAASNFSVAVNLMMALTQAAARVLGAERYDVEIVEAHHKRKVDAPSGTALALAEAVASGRGASLEAVRRDGRSGETGARPAGEIGIHALRAGEIVGEHRVHFIGARDRLEIAHSAQDRALFADGALVAAQWLSGKPPGRYSMMEVLGLGDWVTG